MKNVSASILSILSACVLVTAMACANDSDSRDDESLYLTGTEEEALRSTSADGGTAVSCPTPEKVLICHVPPGNPDAAHTICVGKAAEEAHAQQHGDKSGACADDAEAETPDAGGEVVETPGESGGATPDAGEAPGKENGKGQAGEENPGKGSGRPADGGADSDDGDDEAPATPPATEGLK